jgi:hypothetical protein
MIELKKHILFFDFLQKYYSPTNFLNVVKKNFVKEDKTVVKSSHPRLENLLIEYKAITVKAFPFQNADSAHPENRKIIDQNNFVNQSFQTIGQQLDRIEEKKIPTLITPVAKIEKPLLSLPEGRKPLGLKTTSQKSLEKFDKMLFELKVSQASTLGKDCTIQRKVETFDYENIECSHYSTYFDIKILEENFGKIDLETKTPKNFR